MSTMQQDVDRLVRAAEKLAGTWPSPPPPPIPEVAIVARHGKAAVPLLMLLLSDDPTTTANKRSGFLRPPISRNSCAMSS